MVKKKRTIQRDNNIAVLIREEKEREERQRKKLQERDELRRERKEELIEKLQKVADKINGAPSAPSGAGGGDVEMSSSISMRKHGVIRKIGKKKGAKAGAKVKASKAVLKAAKEQGVVPSVKYARQVLEGKKKRDSKPDGQERKRDKILRRAREKRERRGPKIKGEDDEEAEEEEG